MTGRSLYTKLFLPVFRTQFCRNHCAYPPRVQCEQVHLHGHLKPHRAVYRVHGASPFGHVSGVTAHDARHFLMHSHGMCSNILAILIFICYLLVILHGAACAHVRTVTRQYGGLKYTFCPRKTQTCASSIHNTPVHASRTARNNLSTSGL